MHCIARPAGYGNTGPQKCWAAAWLICIQGIGNVLLNAVVLGLMFAKVASPKASLGLGCSQAITQVAFKKSGCCGLNATVPGSHLPRSPAPTAE